MPSKKATSNNSQGSKTCKKESKGLVRQISTIIANGRKKKMNRNRVRLATAPASSGVLPIIFMIGSFSSGKKAFKSKRIAVPIISKPRTTCRSFCYPTGCLVPACDRNSYVNLHLSHLMNQRFLRHRSVWLA